MRFFLLSILLFAAFLVHAQETDTWIIEERCLPEPTTPPENWSYDGTILVQSPVGIHGINQAWETRRILAYDSDRTRFYFLSPDARTWLTFQGSSRCLGSCDTVVITLDTLTVHNLASLNPENHQIDWYLFTYDNWKRPEGGRGLPILRWLSPSQFTYANSQGAGETPVIYDLITGDIEIYETPVYLEDWHNISPDRTLVIDRVDNVDFTRQYFLSNPQDLSPIVEIPADFIPLNYSTLNVWSPDSQYFLAAKQISEESEGVSLWLMNRNGDAVYSIIDSLIVGEPQLHLDIDWSPDGRYLTIFGNNETAWLIDLQNRHSYNLCRSSFYYGGIAWSPNSQQLALQVFDFEEEKYTPLSIFEPATWLLYEVADNPDAAPVGWQAEEE